MDNQKIISFKSLSDSTVEYLVDLESLTCSCEHFLNRTYRFNRDDPRRLCKHLIKALVQFGVPDCLKQNEGEIAFFASKGMAYTTREKLRKQGKEGMFNDAIKTIIAKKKVKYLYLSGLVDTKTVEATIELVTGDASFQINGYWGSYNATSNQIALRKSYTYLSDAMKRWLKEEYLKTTQ